MTSVPRNEKKAVATGSSGDRTKQFLHETWVELRYKVSWPNREQLIKSTCVVLVGVVIIALYVYVLDMSLGWVLRNTIHKS